MKHFTFCISRVDIYVLYLFLQKIRKHELRAGVHRSNINNDDINSVIKNIKKRCTKCLLPSEDKTFKYLPY